MANKIPTDKQVEKEIASLEAELVELRENEGAHTEQEEREAIISLEDRIGGIKWARGL